MSTVEKLLVQIFERKKSTIEQVRQQTELYSQHLASKLLINGIPPPSWLWDPNASSNSKGELDKEELISKLLRPHTQLSARCSFASYPFYNNLVTTGDNEAFSEKCFMENIAFNKGHHRQDDPTVPEFGVDDHNGCAINSVPEQDNSVTSPENQAEERILNIYNAAEQSLSRIQRSRPRQKALELRNSAKSQAKSCSRHENESNSLSNQIKFSLSSIEPGGQKGEVAKSVEPRVVSQSFEMLLGDGLDLPGKENEMDLDSGRNTRSRSYSKGQVFVRDSLTPGCSSKDCGKRKGSDCITKDKTIDNRTDRITKYNISSNHHNCAFDSSRAGSTDDYQRFNAATEDSRVDDLPPDNVDGLLVWKSSEVQCEGCEAQGPVSEDRESHRRRPMSPSVSSGQLNYMKNIPDVEISCNSAKADGDIPDPSSGKSSRLVTNSKELPGTAKLSVGCFHRVTKSHTRSNDQEDTVSGDLENHEVNFSYGELNCTKDVSDLESPCTSAKADGDIPAPSSRSRCLVNKSKELWRSDKPSIGFSRRVTRSQAHFNAQEKPEPADYNESHSLAGTISKSEDKQKSTNVELQNLNRGPPLLETHNMLGENESPHNFIPSAVKKRRQLDSHIVFTPSGSFESVEPIQPNFIENEEHNVKASVTSSQKRRFASSAERKSCSLSDPDVFVDGAVSGDINQLSMDHQSVPKSNCEKKYANVELQNVKKDPPLHEAHDMMVGENETVHTVILSNDKERRQLESPIVSTPPVSFEYVASMQPSFIENEEQNLKASASSSQKRFANASEKVSCSLPDLAIFVDKGVSGDVNQLSISKESVSESNCEQKSENVEVQIVNGSPSLHETHHTLGEHEISHDFISSNAKERSQAESHIVSTPSGFFESLKPMQRNSIRNEECNLEASASISQKRRFANSTGKIICSLSDLAIFVDKRVSDNVDQLSTCKPSQQMLDVAVNVEEARCDCCETDAREDPYTRADRSRSVVVSDDIPNLQIHAVKHHLEYGFGALQEQHCNEECGEGMDADQLMPNSPDGENLGLSPLQNSAKEPRLDSCDSIIGEIQKEYSICVDQIENSSARDYVCLKGQNTGCSTVVSPPPENSLWRKCAHVSMESWPKLKRRKTEPQQTQSSTDPSIPSIRMPQGILRNPDGKYLEYMNTSIDTILTNTADVNKSVDVEALQKIGSNLREEIEPTFSSHKAKVDSSLEYLTLANSMLDEKRSPKCEGGSQAQPNILCSSAGDLNLVDVDHSLPVFEGFTVDAEVDSDELEFEANGVNFDKIALPRDTIERASILAEICKSASLLEEDCKLALEATPYYDFQAYSGLQFDWNSRNHYGSPVGNPWGNLSSHSRSSGKSLSSNPELVCFPIEEDPTSSEENKSMDEHVEIDIQEQVDQSSTHHCDRRPPCKDLTNLDTSVPAQDVMPRADSADFMSKKLNVTGANDKVQQSTEYQYRDESQALEKEVSYVRSTNGKNSQTLSVGTSGIRKTKVSINNSISKPTRSNKISLKRQDEKFSLRGSGRNNNIVSTVTSFIPMVQAKKDAAVCTGKRDVKVKSIAAAEAAKRWEEKKENERRMKKEALKQERAKLEEKNSRNMELEKKKKEEERKKKDADIMARKRLREEKTKKEKEKKRVKLETMQRQRKQDEKMRAEKVVKEKQKSKDEQMNSKREFHNELKKQHNRETSKGNETASERTENKCTPTDAVMNYEECGTSGQSCEVEKVMHTVDKSPRKEDSIVQNSQGKSYEISPYQCSDDEDDEEEELPPKKSIPAWASKHSVALLLPLQQDMDPDVVFPPQSFCSIDEVLLPRKVQQNLAATT